MITPFPVGLTDGSDVKLRGQGPRGYGRAARRLPAFEARDADGVTPLRYRWKRRLGRRTEAGPRQLLRRVSQRSRRCAPYLPNDNVWTAEYIR
jgi:hypothetical protein